MPILRNASVPSAMLGRPGSGLERVDIAVADGLINAITPHQPGPGRDLEGGLVLPAFVDMHTHLDKGQIWPRKPNPDGTWIGALLAVQTDRDGLWSKADVGRRMDFALRTAYAHGTAAIRTHLDSIPPQQLISWDLFAEVRDAWRGRIELQAVALIHADCILDPAQLDAVARKAKEFGGLLGGAVMSDPRAKQAMLKLVEKAGESGLDIDVHADETGDPGSDTLERLAEAVLETGYTGRVTAGHCCALTAQDEATQQRTIDKVARAGIAIVSLPMCNMYLQDRDADGRTTPVRRGVTLLKELRAAGVRVAIASDNTRDPFYAYGDLDALEVLREGARILHFDHPRDAAWSWAGTVAYDAAAIAGFDYTAQLAAGASADLVMFRARTWTELLSRPQADRQVMRRGELIDTTLPDYRELDDLMEA
ncbi:MAG: cytosine deaminase [Devosia sp. 67-54]|uniref:cytosine deaminase n=1 Tax=unclassified Devosia TaxID=196773 RepID=UPI00095EA2A0|nr:MULTISPECIES: cytosine deaminase [unclassified Devosia]MBN9307601.1 cytosine deaminase [Devosia sp.]OJX19975.1 MAG: cytosine deaminase [Devosia sp. 67-54]